MKLLPTESCKAKQREKSRERKAEREKQRRAAVRERTVCCGAMKYGLQVPKRHLKKPLAGAKVLKPTLGIFGNDDDDDDEQNDNVESQIAAQQRHAHSIAKNENLYKEALEQDPTVFDYDDVYDSFKSGESSKNRKDEKLNRQSKYIADLKAKAVEREREQNMVYERRKVKEVEKEEHFYGQKEKFITSAYRKKLEEEKQWKERERLEEEEERRNDVTKRGNLGNFYKNLMTEPKKKDEIAPSSRESDRSDRKREEKLVSVESRPPRTSAPMVRVPAERKEAAETGSYKRLSGSPEKAFIESSSFNGTKSGYVYKKGPRGLGYYADEEDAPELVHDDQWKKEKKPQQQQQQPPSQGMASNGVESAESKKRRYLERYLERKRKKTNQP